jgi:biopolymer transport protein ExbB/TolQ
MLSDLLVRCNLSEPAMMWFVQEIFTPMVLMLMLGACSVAVIVLGVYATAALREEERRVADLARAGERLRESRRESQGWRRWHTAI